MVDKDGIGADRREIVDVDREPFVNDMVSGLVSLDSSSHSDTSVDLFHKPYAQDDLISLRGYSLSLLHFSTSPSRVSPRNL